MKDEESMVVSVVQYDAENQLQHQQTNKLYGSDIMT